MRQDLTTDGLHLNAQGYLVWSTAINFFSLQQLEAQPTASTPTANPPEPPEPAIVTQAETMDQEQALTKQPPPNQEPAQTTNTN